MYMSPPSHSLLSSEPKHPTLPSLKELMKHGDSMQQQEWQPLERGGSPVSSRGTITVEQQSQLLQQQQMQQQQLVQQMQQQQQQQQQQQPTPDSPPSPISLPLQAVSMQGIPPHHTVTYGHPHNAGGIAVYQSSAAQHNPWAQQFSPTSAPPSLLCSLPCCYSPPQSHHATVYMTSPPAVTAPPQMYMMTHATTHSPSSPPPSHHGLAVATAVSPVHSMYPHSHIPRSPSPPSPPSSSSSSSNSSSSNSSSGHGGHHHSHNHSHHNSHHHHHGGGGGGMHHTMVVTPPSPPRSSSPKHKGNKHFKYHEFCNFSMSFKTLKQEKRVKKRNRKAKPRDITTIERACSACGIKNTPQWRSGPLGRGTLCNACGLKERKRLKKREQVLPPVQAVQSVIANQGMSP